MPYSTVPLLTPYDLPPNEVPQEVEIWGSELPVCCDASWPCYFFFQPRIEKLEAGEGDEWEFLQWQARMRKLDREKELEEFEQRRLAGLLSQEQSIIARQKLIQLKKDHVAEMKAEVALSFKTSHCSFIVSQSQFVAV